jgi:hypothetical protein
MFTDRDGRFTFKTAPHMRATLQVRKPEFFDEIQLRGDGAKQTVTIGPEMAPVILKLSPAGEIGGHVVDLNGDPLDQIPILIRQFRVVDGRKQTSVMSTKTDDNGEFAIAGLMPGSFVISAGPYWNEAEAQAKPGAKVEVYPRVYYADADEPSSATAVQLAPGQHVELDFRINLTPTLPVSGLVVGGRPGPVEAKLEFVNAWDDEISLPPQMNAQGQFEAHVIPGGSCRIKAYSRNLAGRSLYSENLISLATPVAGLHLTPVLPPDIPVNIRMETTRPVPLSRPTTATDAANRFRTRTFSSVPALPVQVSLRLRDTLPRRASSHRLDQDRVSGLAALHDVEPGEYWVDVSAREPSWYIRSVECGGTNLLQEMLTVGSSGIQPIEIVVRDDSAALSGTVAGSEGEAYVTVVIASEGTPFHPQTAHLREDGTFEIQGLAPGDYKVFAFDDTYGLEYKNPEILHNYDAQAASITLQPNGKASLRLDVIHRGE